MVGSEGSGGRETSNREQEIGSTNGNIVFLGHHKGEKRLTE